MIQPIIPSPSSSNINSESRTGASQADTIASWSGLIRSAETNVTVTDAELDGSSLAEPGPPPENIVPVYSHWKMQFTVYFFVVWIDGVPGFRD
jgi:hypothetical protein